MSVLPAASGDAPALSLNRYGLHQFARLTFLLAPVRDVPEHWNYPVQRTDLLPDAPNRVHTLTRIPSLPDRPSQRTRTAQPTAYPTAGAPEPADPSLACPSAHPVLTAARPSPHLKRSSAAAQLALYRMLELSADDADACVAQPAGASHLAALPWRSGVLSAPTLPAFDAKLLATAPGTLSHLMLLTDPLPYAFFDDFLAAPALTHIALPHFVGVPHAADDVPPASAPRLAVLDSGHGLAAALAPSRPLRRVTLRIASTLYDGLRPAALFGVLGGSLKEVLLVLALDVDVHTRVVIRHAGEYERGAGCLTSSRIPIAERAGALYAPPAGISADRGRKSGPSRPALWTRPPQGSTLRRVSFRRSVGT
ncbi:hypothetical protein EDB86DRAFT_3103675 [Lactarius hatsudake]|nr:hypothetical protein EDB86DRAFT_3103675 [Lactarius hatsudake]